MFSPVSLAITIPFLIDSFGPFFSVVKIQIEHCDFFLPYFIFKIRLLFSFYVQLLLPLSNDGCPEHSNSNQSQRPYNILICNASINIL